MLTFGVLWVVALSACASSGGSGGTRGPANRASAVSHQRSAAPAEDTSRGQSSTRFRGKRMGVRLVITPSRVAPGQSPTAIFINTGKGSLAYSFPFKVERRTDRGWRWINRRQAFTLPLLPLAPGERSEPQSLAVYRGGPTPVNLRPGLYRVTKSFDLTSGVPRPATISVSASFRVTTA
jgi:hypothetical protein